METTTPTERFTPPAKGGEAAGRGVPGSAFCRDRALAAQLRLRRRATAAAGTGLLRRRGGRWLSVADFPYSPGAGAPCFLSATHCSTGPANTSPALPAWGGGRVREGRKTTYRCSFPGDFPIKPLVLQEAKLLFFKRNLDCF